MTAPRWEELVLDGEAFTCYSAALAAWVAVSGDGWREVLDAGLHLVVVEAEDGLFGFAHFPPDLGHRLGLVRRGAADTAMALEGIRQELRGRGRVVVAGDGYHLPWHTA